LAFLAFCAISSSIYLINDIIDVRRDQSHPVKRNRPIASGKISVFEAMLISFILLSFSLFISLQILNLEFTLIIVFYFFSNLIYSLKFKNIVVLDIMIIAIGFLMRALAGAVAINVIGSPWLFITVLMVSLFFALGKRRTELIQLDQDAASHRKALNQYSVSFIDSLMNICISSSVVMYALYTLASHTIERFHTRLLFLTTPIVIFGLFRYLYNLQSKNAENDPVKIILTDPQILISFFLWLAMIGVIIYMRIDVKIF
jgi:4-hydroxybenzoate polyprenyltransferase